MGKAYFSRPRPRLFGHRGAAGLAPENTMESFRRALEDGAGYLELDVHATRDGVVVVLHDPTVDRTTNGSGAVRDLSFAEVHALDAGFRFVSRDGRRWRGQGVHVPSLEQLLEELPNVPLNIEIKQDHPPIEEAVAALLRAHGAIDRVVLAAEEDAIMKRIRTAVPEVSTSLSALETREFFERCFAGDLGGFGSPGKALQIPERFGDITLVTEDTLAAAHGSGLEIHVWTVNERVDMNRLLDLGVDGIMSDFPGLLVSTAQGRQRRP